MNKRAILLIAALSLSGCGLQPLYSNGEKGTAVQMLNTVSVGPIPERAGWLVRNAIIDRIGDHGGTARYRLDIKLDDQIQGFGIRSDSTTTRERRTLRARYQLVDTSNNTTLIDATAGSDAGIDIVNSEYATIAAEQTALERLAGEVADQIVTHIAIQARKDEAGKGGKATP